MRAAFSELPNHDVLVLLARSRGVDLRYVVHPEEGRTRTRRRGLLERKIEVWLLGAKICLPRPNIESIGLNVRGECIEDCLADIERRCICAVKVREGRSEHSKT